MAEVPQFVATGKRKTAVTRARVKAGTGQITVNGRALLDYFPRETSRIAVVSPLVVTESLDRFDVVATAHGGGCTAQAEALRHGIARALCEADAKLRPALKKAGLLTRDARIRERKKYGQPGARKRYQYSKR